MVPTGIVNNFSSRYSCSSVDSNAREYCLTEVPLASPLSKLMLQEQEEPTLQQQLGFL